MLYSDHMHTHTYTIFLRKWKHFYVFGLGMQATNAEAPAGSGVPSDVDEGMCITREMIYH